MRIARDLWFTCGFELFQREGPGGIRVDVMCQQLNLSREAFYHHFANLAEFQSSLLESWEQHCREEIAAVAESLNREPEQHQLLNQIANQINRPLENALEAWGMFSSKVNGSLERVVSLRIQLLEQLLERDGHSPSDAQAEARKLYARIADF